MSLALPAVAYHLWLVSCVGETGHECGAYRHFVRYSCRAGLSAICCPRHRRDRHLVVSSDRLGLGGFRWFTLLQGSKEGAAFLYNGIIVYLLLISCIAHYSHPQKCLSFKVPYQDLGLRLYKLLIIYSVCLGAELCRFC